MEMSRFMTAICLETTNHNKPNCFRRLVMCVSLAAIIIFSQPLRAQAKFPIQSNVQAVKANQAAAIADVQVPNLVWLPRESAAIALRNAHLQGKVDDSQPGNVVIAQTIPAGARVPANSVVGYTVGQPRLKLEPVRHTTHPNNSVQFTVTLFPNLPAGSAPVVYEFVWKPGERAVLEKTNTFVEHAPRSAGLYEARVSTIVNDVPLESNPAAITVERISSGPTPAQGTPTPSLPDSRSTSLKALLLVVVILGTLAAAYGFHKWKSRRGIAAAPRLKVSTGNQRIQSKILEPDALKSKSLTRVRWVRGPICSKIMPENGIVKKKEAAHA
jgi:hypothetical protein